MKHKPTLIKKKIEHNAFSFPCLLKCCSNPWNPYSSVYCPAAHHTHCFLMLYCKLFLFFYHKYLNTTLHTCLAAWQNNFLRSPEINLLPSTVVQVQKVVYLIDFIFHLSGDKNAHVGSVSMQNRLSIWRVTSVTVPSSHVENWEPAKTNEESKILWNGGRRGREEWWAWYV